MRAALALALLVGCGADSSGERDAAVEIDATPAVDATIDAPPSTVVTEVVSTTHRYVAGAMFGGWGPHLGHLIELGPRTLWVDDGCDQAGGAEGCDVEVNRRLEYHERTAAGWVRRASLPLPARIQQNTATISVGGGLSTIGVDVAGQRMIECRMNPTTWAGGCAPFASALPASTNYVGAAVSPTGHKVAWASTVVDGGGGSFHWYADYGGGWNGPRTGGVLGFNDSSYLHVGFVDNRMTIVAQLVGGLAPNWTFHAATGEADVGSAQPAIFQPLASAGDDPLISTADVVVDPITGDVHLLARTGSGAVAYVHRSNGGAWTAPVVVLPATFRARWLVRADGALGLVSGPAGAGLALRTWTAAERATGTPLAIAARAARAVPLPAGYASVDGIYPASPIYQRALPSRFAFAIVGRTRQHEILYVTVD